MTKQEYKMIKKTIQNNKTLLLLPFLTILSACGTSGSNDAVVKDRSDHATTLIDAIVREKSAYDWQDSTIPEDNTVEFVADSAELQALEEMQATQAKFTLYFPYDDFDIDELNTQEIIKHANFMRNNPKIKLRLEGHADERGTREYNLALGENRAISVKEVLSLYQGLSSRVQTISYGEEKPVVEGHDEAAWEKNRRVEFVYQLNAK